MPPPSDPRNLRAKWQRALEERRKAGATAEPLDVTPRAPAREGRANAREAKGYTRPDKSNARAGRAGTSDRDEAAAVAPAIENARSTPEPVPEPAPDSERDPKREAAPEQDTASEARATRAAAKPSVRMVAPRDDAGDFPRPAAKPGAAKDDSESPAGKKPDAPSSPWTSALAALVLVGGVGFALRTFLLAEDAPLPPDADPVLVPSGAASADPVSLTALARPPQSTRCTTASKDPFVVGDTPAPKPSASASDGDDAPDDDLAPFAVELGRGVRFADGFAVGTQRQAEGGTVAMVATLGADGQQGKLVRLARSRGDFDPPIVTAAGAAILVAMTEPNAGGRAIRIAKVEGERVTWGPELSEGRDESSAVDIATAGARALVVWDDVPAGHERSVVELATFDVGTMQGSGARAITPSTIDADGPRLAVRPGGYWLSYLVHGDPPTQPTAAKDDGPEDAGAAAKKGRKPATSNDDDSDTEAAGEAIAHQWIELIPLDESGAAAGAARAVTPKESRVIAYDLDEGADGRVLLIYREDDTPSGSTGGRVKVITAELGGIGEPHVIAEEGVGTGVPQLHGGWVVIHSLSGPVRLGAIGPGGELTGELAPEPILKQGEILAAEGGTFLVATPAGRAMLLGVVRCTR